MAVIVGRATVLYASDDTMLWSAWRTVEMHGSGEEGVVGRCKGCPEGGDACPMLEAARARIIQSGRARQA
jgi:hypothetical protein